MVELAALPQAWPLPSRPRPIVCVGAGGIVENAHLPAYRRCGFPVLALVDPDLTRARRVASAFGVPGAQSTLEAWGAAGDVVFDVAVPARVTGAVLKGLPDGATVLIQKPFGESWRETCELLELCRQKRLVAAVNFQLRFSPAVLALRALLASGAFGDILDFEVRVNVHTPWADWPFLAGIPRHEVLYHSVHYLDLARCLLGEPRGVHCHVARHPALAAYSDTSSATLLDFGAACRVVIGAFHTHTYGRRHQTSELKVEGTLGAAVMKIGVNLDYPRGEPDTLEVCFENRRDWQAVPLRGSWFIEAFEGSMSHLQRFAAGEDPVLSSSVEDAALTMAVVEACYASSAHGATPPPSLPCSPAST